METLSACLIILDYDSQEMRIRNTQSHSLLIFHLLSILKNTWQLGLHFIHVIDSMNLPKGRSSDMRKKKNQKTLFFSEDFFPLHHITREKRKKINDKSHCACS